MLAAASPAAPSSGAVHVVAAVGFGAEVDAYEKARPSYPPAAVAALLRGVGMDAASKGTVVDLGAGTGKFTRLLKAACPLAKVVAVDQSEKMLAKLQEISSDVTALQGDAYKLPLEDASVDAIVCAQAFHWFADDAALKEMHRVLRPGGSLGLIWNLEDRAAPWVAALRDVYEAYEADTPQYRRGLWRAVWGGRVAGELFSPLLESHEQFAHTVLTERGDIWRRVLSKSYVAMRSEAEKEEVRARCEAVVQKGEGMRVVAGQEGVEEERQVVEYPYVTDVFFCKKL